MYKRQGESSLKGKRVRVVIGSTSTGGDSYMIADMVTRYLGEEMGFNGKVDAIGNAQALDTISKAKGDVYKRQSFPSSTVTQVPTTNSWWVFPSMEKEWVNPASPRRTRRPW